MIYNLDGYDRFVIASCRTKLTVLLTTITFPIFYANFGLDFVPPLKKYDIERSTALHMKILGAVEVHLGFSSLLEY